MNFAILWLFAKVFSGKFGVWHSLAQYNPRNLSAKIIFFTNLRKFSPSEVYCFVVIANQILLPEFPQRYNNGVNYSPDPSFFFGGLEVWV